MLLPLFVILFLANVSEGRDEFPIYDFELKVDESDYTGFVSSLEEKLGDPDILRQLKHPAYCLKIDSIVAGSQADKAGVKPGWLIARMNGVPICHHRHWYSAEIADDAERIAEFYTPKGRLKTFTFGPGMIGYTRGNYWVPELQVLRMVAPGLWDRHLMVAVKAWERGQSEIAETALFWAVEAGMPPNLASTIWAALLELNKGDSQKSSRLYSAAIESLEKNESWPNYFFRGLETLAFAHDDWETLGKVTAYRDYEGDFRKKELEPWTQWKRPKQSLSERIKGQEGPNEIGKVITVKADWMSKSAQKGALQVRAIRKGRFSRELKQDHYNYHVFTLPENIQNVVVRFSLLLGSSKQPLKRKAPSSVFFRLIDLDWREREDSFGIYRETESGTVSATMIGAGFGQTNYSERYVFFRSGDSKHTVRTQFIVPWLDWDESKELGDWIGKWKGAEPQFPERLMNVEMIRLNGEAEVSVNGIRLVNLPVPEKPDRLGVQIQFVGAVALVKDLELRRLPDSEPKGE